VLGTAVAVDLEWFGGYLSYASLPIEGVDWPPCDVITTDAGYRSVEVAAGYREGIGACVAPGQCLGKPMSAPTTSPLLGSGPAGPAGPAAQQMRHTSVASTSARATQDP
jgi:hypothetical protein